MWKFTERKRYNLVRLHKNKVPLWEAGNIINLQENGVKHAWRLKHMVEGGKISNV